MSSTDEFYRIQKLPPYVFAVINEMKAKARAAQLDVVDLGMGNPDGSTPRAVVSKLVEAVRNPRNHRYSLSKGIPKLREAMVARYKANYDVPIWILKKKAIVTIGAKTLWRTFIAQSSARATRWCLRTLAIRSISTESSWRKGTPVCCLCPIQPLFLNSLEDLAQEVRAQTAHDSDLFSTHPHHANRGIGFL